MRVWGGCIIGRRVSAPSGKVFPCIRAAQAWSRLGGGELCVRRGIRWLIVREAPWKLPETRYQLLPGPPPQTHHSGGGVGAGLAQQSPLPAPPPTGTPSGLPLPTRQLKCPMGPQGTKRSLVPKITPDAKVIFQPGPGGLGLPIPQSKASNRQGPGGGCSETRPPRGTDPSLAGLQARLLSSQNSPKSHLHIRKRRAGFRTQAGLTAKPLSSLLHHSASSTLTLRGKKGAGITGRRSAGCWANRTHL